MFDGVIANRRLDYDMFNWLNVTQFRTLDNLFDRPNYKIEKKIALFRQIVCILHEASTNNWDLTHVIEIISILVSTLNAAMQSFLNF